MVNDLRRTSLPPLSRNKTHHQSGVEGDQSDMKATPGRLSISQFEFGQRAQHNLTTAKKSTIQLLVIGVGGNGCGTME